MKDESAVFGILVKKYRDEAGMTMKQLGDIAFNPNEGTGSDRRSDIWRLERGGYLGVKNPEIVKRIVEALDIPIREVPRSLLWEKAKIDLSINIASRLQSRGAGLVEEPNQFSDHSRHYSKSQDRGFLTEVLHFVENGHYRQNLELVQASVNFILTCDDQGMRTATDDLCSFILRDRNILERDEIPPDLIATVEHANERGSLTDERDYCLSSGVPKDRLDAANVCLACSHLKHRRLREAEPIIESLWETRNGLSDENRARVYGLSGRLLLHRSNGSDKSLLLKARDRLAVAARSLPANDMHVYHHEMLRAVASWLLTKNESDATAIKLAASRVAFGVGESCIVPNKVMHELVVGQ